MEIDYRQLAQSLISEAGGGVRTKAVGSTPTATYAHGGKGGLFSAPGLSRPLFTAMVLPSFGLASALPVRSSNETNPLFGIITGVTASSGDEPEGVCDDPPTAGLAKLCTHTFAFGRLSRQSKVFDIDRVGKIINRSDFTDFQVMGNPFDVALGPTVPGGAVTPAEIARSEVAKSMFELATAWSRDFAKLTWTGNPTNNTAGGGYAEFYGLESLVNTGYRDALTGIACPAADSIVRDFNGLDVHTSPDTAVKWITNTYRNLKFLARKAGLEPVRWVLAMTFGMFYELTDVWPMSYLTYRNVITMGSNTAFVQTSEAEKMREEMRGDLYNYSGQFLLIDGQRVPVVIDDTIPETDLGGAFRSDLYFIPLTVLGQVPVTYWETFNYEAAGTIDFARAFAPGDTYYTSDGGRFLWHKKPPTNFCVQLLAKTEPRLLMLTPYLAARLENLDYQPIEHERSWETTVPSYYKDGGRTEQDTTVPSYYSPTA